MSSSPHAGGRQPTVSTAVESQAHGTDAMFDVLPGDRVPAKDSVLMGFQNIFVMTGIFVFPGIMGKSFGLPMEYGRPSDSP